MMAARRNRTVQRRRAEWNARLRHAETGPTARKPPRRVLLRRLPAGVSGPGLSDDPANVVVPLGHGVPTFELPSLVMWTVSSTWRRYCPYAFADSNNTQELSDRPARPRRSNSRACPATGQDSRRAR